MSKKTVIQVLLIFLIFLISVTFYLKYFNDSPKALQNKVLEKKTSINQNNSSTYIDNIDYVSFDVKGNKYNITAKQSEIKIENTAPFNGEYVDFTSDLDQALEAAETSLAQDSEAEIAENE